MTSLCAVRIASRTAERAYSSSLMLRSPTILKPLSLSQSHGMSASTLRGAGASWTGLSPPTSSLHETESTAIVKRALISLAAYSLLKVYPDSHSQLYLRAPGARRRALRRAPRAPGSG